MTLHKSDFYSTAQVFKMSSSVRGSVIRPLQFFSPLAQAISIPYEDESL